MRQYSTMTVFLIHTFKKCNIDTKKTNSKDIKMYILHELLNA